MQTHDEIRHFYLEADRSTEEHRRLREKFVGYWWHLQDRGFAQPRGRPRVNVLFVTTSPRRMQAMIDTLRHMRKPNRARHGGKGHFRFCCESSYDLEESGPAFGAIWASVNQSAMTLLPR